MVCGSFFGDSFGFVCSFVCIDCSYVGCCSEVSGYGVVIGCSEGCDCFGRGC